MTVVGPFTLVDLVVLAGVAIVLPMALPGTRRWFVAAAAVALSFGIERGPLAAAFVVPWLAVATTTAVEAGWGWWSRPSLVGAADAVAAGWAVVAAVALAASRLGLALFGVGEPIVELTAVHFIYAGTASLVLAAHALEHATVRWTIVGRAAVVLTGGAPVLVATGFVTRSALLQVGGAIVMALGVWGTATLELRRACERRPPTPVRALLATSGLAVWIPMVLAVAWAAGQHWDVPALSIPDMQRTHGLANALGFVLAGLLARRLTAPAVGHAAHPLRPAADRRRSGRPWSRPTPTALRRARRRAAGPGTGPSAGTSTLAG